MSEQEKAQTASSEEVTLFDRIVAGQIPANIIYQDEQCLAFRDINPTAPVHFLVIPKNRDGLSGISKAEPRHAALLGHLMVIAGQVGNKECPEGFRIVVNEGKHGCQSVYHVHIHVIGGKQLGWPPGTQ